jgi:7-cyano-7-deazaguanine tRNA-ribosyltransferase
VCRSHTQEELRTAPDRERLLALHNLYVTIAEIARIRQAIFDGTLWELVDERCRGHPQLLAAYRAFLKGTPDLEKQDRVSKRRFFYRGDESCARTEVIRYQQMLSRLCLGKNVLVAFDGGIRDEFDTTLFFKPPFGPYPKELKETFPIGQSEIPEWDETMVRQGCQGIRMLITSHPESHIVVSCNPAWKKIVLEVVGDIEVRNDQV